MPVLSWPRSKSDFSLKAFLDQSVSYVKKKLRLATLHLLCESFVIAACIGIFLFRKWFATSITGPMPGPAPEIAPVLFIFLQPTVFGAKKIQSSLATLLMQRGLCSLAARISRTPLVSTGVPLRGPHSRGLESRWRYSRFIRSTAA